MTGTLRFERASATLAVVLVLAWTGCWVVLALRGYWVCWALAAYGAVVLKVSVRDAVKAYATPQNRNNSDSAP